MIKVEVLEGENGIRLIFFEAMKEEDRDKLDLVLEALAGPYPKRGGFVLGTLNPTLKLEVNLKS